MTSVMKVKENVRRISQQREFEQAKRTEGCLLATCFHRYVFNMKYGRDPKLDECPETCCYHPGYKPKLHDSESSPGRSRRRVGSYSALESQFQAANINRQEDGNYTDPSPF